jgi:hypothetical protein
MAITIDGTAGTIAGLVHLNITDSSTWGLTVPFVPSDAEITTNLAEFPTTHGYARIGSAMSESGGIFTFPSAGYWEIDFMLFVKLNSGTTRTYLLAMTTLNNSTWNWSQAMCSMVMTGIGTNSYDGRSASMVFKVADTTTHKIRFYAGKGNTGYSPSIHGGTDGNDRYTSFRFTKLRDL